MTLQELEHDTRYILLASDIAPILGVDPQDIRGQAHTHPEKLGFPVIVTGTRVRIPRIGFIHYMKYGKGERQ